MNLFNKFILISVGFFTLFKTHAQTEARMVLPVGHTHNINTAVFSPDGKLALTASGDNTARIFEVSSGKELQVLSGHTWTVSSAVFSPDGKLALTASWDNTSRIFEVSSGKQLQVLSGHTAAVYSAVFSPDGKLALTASLDDSARIFEVSSGKQLQVLSGHTGTVSSAVFSPDGKLALTASGDNTARIFEVSSGKELQVLTGHSDWVNNAVFSPDGKLALTASSDKTARIFEVSSGKQLQVLAGHSSYICDAVFSPDGKLALTASGDNTARIFEVNSGKQLQVLAGHSDEVYSSVFSPDGKLALTASRGNTPRIFEVSSGKQLQVLAGHSSYVSSAVFSPVGKLALTASGDTARIFEVSSGKELQLLAGHSDYVYSAVFSPDGKLALTASSDKTARIFEVSSGKELQVLSGHTGTVSSAIFSPDGNLALTASRDETARIFEVSSGKQLQVLAGHSDEVYSAVFSPDGKLALTASLDDSARIFEVSSGKQLQVLSGHTGRVYSAVFSPDGNLALTASRDETARIFEVSSGKELQLLAGHSDYVYSAVFSPDGKLALTASSDKTARIFEVSSGKELQVLSGHTGTVSSAIFSPDGNLALTASRDETARIFEVSSGKQLQVLAGHSDEVYSAVFSPDGKLALTASSDKTARIFEVSSGKELQVLSGHTGRVSSAVFSPDGKYIITTGDDHKIIIWEVATGKALCTRLKLKNNDWLVFDEHYRFDGSPGAIDYLYLTCGLEVIDLSQVKDSLWVPGLAEKIMKGDSILINDRPAPKLKNLNICNLTPIIEPANEGENGLYRYRIIPRNGGLGATEVYINGNLTYSYNPEQLEKRTENKKDVYYLNLAADSLQEFLTGMKGETNPILVKSKVKGSGIYGRGEILNITKESDAKLPAFYGVFVGVNDYGNPEKLSSDLRYNDLSYAAKDANDMANATESVARNLFKDSCHFYRLTGTDSNAPSRANIQNILKEIGLKAKSSDVLFIFFAGHGDLSKNEGDNEIRFILHQADKRNLKSSSFGVAELSLWCHPKNIKAQKRVFVFDACHSGQIINQTMAFNGRGNNEAARIRQLDKLKDKNGMMILAATAENDFAYEDETLNQGVLTFYLLRTIKDSKDTQLIVREWFDDAIEGVKEYSKANGNKQEPNSFGDGRFEVGNVNDTVRRAIQIGCPKIRIASCEFTDPLGSAEKVFPTLKIGISNYFKNGSSRGDFIYSKNYEKSYRVIGSYTMMKKKLVIKYEIKKGDETLGSYSIPPFNTKTESAVLASLTNSILKEIERIDKRDFQCSPYRNRKDQ